MAPKKWRWARDSNPGNLSVQRFSRPPLSTTQPAHRSAHYSGRFAGSKSQSGSFIWRKKNGPGGAFLVGSLASCVWYVVDRGLSANG